MVLFVTSDITMDVIRSRMVCPLEQYLILRSFRDWMNSSDTIYFLNGLCRRTLEFDLTLDVLIWLISGDFISAGIGSGSLLFLLTYRGSLLVGWATILGALLQQPMQSLLLK